MSRQTKSPIPHIEHKIDHKNISIKLQIVISSFFSSQGFQRSASNPRFSFSSSCTTKDNDGQLLMKNKYVPYITSHRKKLRGYRRNGSLTKKIKNILQVKIVIKKLNRKIT